MNPSLLITGGSRGIGAAPALLAAQRGYAVAVNDTPHSLTAKEMALEGIRVNAVRPGVIPTDIHTSGGQPDRTRQMAPVVPMQRAGNAEEVAHAMVWLLSDESGYTTGALLDVAGGH